MPEPGPRRTAGANSSRKVLQLLLSFTEQRWEASVAELAEVIGSPVATTYRYVQLLKELQLLEESRSGRYHVTSRVMPLARAARLANDLTRLARPAMEEAARELGETILLFQHFGEFAVCSDRVECDRAMRFTFQPGYSIPLGLGATGKMLLALLPDGERERHISRIAREHGAELRDALKHALANRYAQSWGEIEDGVWACSVPLDADRLRPSVLSLVGPATRIGDTEQERAIASLRAYAEQIGKAIAEYSV